MKYPLLAVTVSLASFTAFSAPWVEPGDIHLRADIQSLADAGLISAPVNSFPLMWSDIVGDLQQARWEPLAPAQRQAVGRVMQAFERDTTESRSRIEITAATAAHAEPTSLISSQQLIRQSWAGQLQYSLTEAETDNWQDRFDGSYLAATWGNWVVTAGMTESQWGPGWAHRPQSAATAQPALGFSRLHARPSQLPLLRWFGPWSLNAGISETEQSDSDSGDNNSTEGWEWQAGVTARPLTGLELGLKYRGIHSETTEQQQTGSDLAGSAYLRYALPLWQSLAFYGELTSGSGWLLTEQPGYLLGADTRLSFTGRDVRIYSEYASERWAKHRSGHQSAVNGSADDNKPALALLSLGVVGFERISGHQWQLLLQHSEPGTGFEAGYAFPLLEGRAEVSAGYQYDDELSGEPAAAVNWKRDF